MKILKIFKWFYPGLKIKRWLMLSLLGLLFTIFGAIQFLRDSSIVLKAFDAFLFVFGCISIILGIRYFIKSFFEAIYPRSKKQLIDIIYEKRYLSKGPNIVAIGGGTGLSTLLDGLKEFTSNITAIVAVADEGGSSGRLREEFGILPPGDIRNCLVSLAEAPQLMRDLFQYRFQEGNGIKGHSFGNLFITAMTQVTGSFEEAIRESSEVLAIRGRVIPSSLDRIRLRAEYSDGSIKDGEDKIPKVGKPIRKIFLLPENAKSNPEALEVIEQADIIVLGPGSLFTSVVPNLLIRDITERICKKDALKIYICNVMTQSGETDGFTAYDHVKALISHTRRDIINCAIINSGKLEYALLLKYAQEKSFTVISDRDDIEDLGIRIFEGDVVSRTDYLRHNPDRLAKRIMYAYNSWKMGRWRESKKKS